MARRGAGLSPADRALATEIAYGAIRQRELLDGWIDALGKVPALRQPPTLRWLLHVGLYQLLFSRRVPPSAAVSTTVALAKRAGLGRLAPVVNGLLRSLLRRRDNLAEAEPWEGLPLPADPAASLALRRSLPPWLAAELLGWLPPEQAEAFGVACNGAPSFDLRVNRLRTTREALLETFTAAGLAARALPEAPHGITLLERAGDPRDLPGYAEGLWCVQDRSAQRIAPLLDPRPGQRILDACAAPGGKSTHLAELIGDRGEIWAVDRSPARLQRLERNAERLGLGTIRTLAADATRLLEEKPHWRGSFDRILLDAPCSGPGHPGPASRRPLADHPRGHRRAGVAPAPAAGGAPASAGPGGTACLCHLHGASSGELRPHRQPAEGPSRLVSPPGTPVVAAACRWGVRGWGRLLRGGAGGAECWAALIGALPLRGAVALRWAAGVPVVQAQARAQALAPGGALAAAAPRHPGSGGRPPDPVVGFPPVCS